MKLSISREALLDPLQLVAGVVERRQTLPILSNLLLVAEEGVLTITGTDQEVELSATVTDVEIDESGELTVPARKLMDICKSLAGGATLKLTQESSRLSVVSGEFRSHLATLPTIDFPNVEPETGAVALEVPAAILGSLLDKTSFAMAQQDVRLFFNGVLVELEQGVIRLVATNGQRLATSFVEHEVRGDNQRFIVPRKGVHELMRLLNEDSEGDAKLQFSSNHLRAEAANAVLVTKLIDGSYPDYTRAIPSGGDKIMVGNRSDIREALNRTSILSNEMYRNVRLQMDAGKLDIHANNPLQEEADETVSVEYDGGALEIGFNVGYLLDVLSTMRGDKLKIEFIDDSSACLLTDPDDRNTSYVVSPMMV
ncbi:MAG TPA: DNA polymerase III subunit beta [Gammaproteobacteria bacterium]|nr:DNA polymerase III subunit beta [Gammaproteobacteria bacterium]